jgi:hypothetical protein
MSIKVSKELFAISFRAGDGSSRFLRKLDIYLPNYTTSSMGERRYSSTVLDLVTRWK